MKTAGDTGRPVRARQFSRQAVVAGVQLSNPDKILYPEQNISKLALAEFYAAIAGFILPHVIHRTMTPDRYRVDNLPRRLAALKSNPWPDYFTIRQGLPRSMRGKPG